MKNIRFVLSETFPFWIVNFTIYGRFAFIGNVILHRQFKQGLIIIAQLTNDYCSVCTAGHDGIYHDKVVQGLRCLYLQ